MSQTTAPAKIRFDTEICSRCAGSGDYPSACWQGICLKCKGTGHAYTRTGTAAKKAMEAWAEENLSTTYSELKVGDKYLDSSRKVREIVSIKDSTLNPGYIEIKTKHSGVTTKPEFKVRVPWTAEAMQRMAAEVLGRRKGWEWG